MGGYLVLVGWWGEKSMFGVDVVAGVPVGSFLLGMHRVIFSKGGSYVIQEPDLDLY